MTEDRHRQGEEARRQIVSTDEVLRPDHLRDLHHRVQVVITIGLRLDVGALLLVRTEAVCVAAIFCLFY